MFACDCSDSFILQFLHPNASRGQNFDHKLFSLKRGSSWNNDLNLGKQFLLKSLVKRLQNFCVNQSSFTVEMNIGWHFFFTPPTAKPQVENRSGLNSELNSEQFLLYRPKTDSVYMLRCPYVICPLLETLLSNGLWRLLVKKNIYKKNPAYGRQRICRPMRIVGPIQI